MKKILILPLLLITFISSAQNTPVTQKIDIKTLSLSEGKYYDTNAKLFNGITGYLLNQDDSVLLQVRNGIVTRKMIKKIGKNEAYIEYFRENGVIDRSRFFVNNKFEGIAKFYSDNGKVERVANYHEGKRQGSDISYFENGKIKDKSYWINDNLEGVSESFREDGTISSRMNYRDGKLDGPFLVFLLKSVLSSVTMYKNGEKNGVEEIYDHNGKVSRATSYTSDKIISVNKYPTKSVYPNILKSLIEESKQPLVAEQSKSQAPNQSKEEIDKELAEFLAGPKLIIQESGVKVSEDKFSTGIPFVGTVDSKSDKRYYTQKELTELHKPAYIIGTPIKVGKFIVAQHEFPVKYIWKNAKGICATLGPGWRLPTKEELYILYQNKNKIGNFSKYGYWSSSTGNQEGVAWHQDFYLGGTKPSIANKNSPWGVRAVKSQ